MLVEVAVAAVELARALPLPGKLSRRERRETGVLPDPGRGAGGRSGAPLPGRGDRYDPGQHKDGGDERNAAAHWPSLATDDSPPSPSRAVLGKPMGGGSLCLMGVWQRAHSMFFPATWKSWTKAVSV